MVDDEAKRLGEPPYLDERKRSATTRRRDRAAERIRKSGREGARALYEAQWQAKAGMPAATILARAKPEVRTAIAPAIREGFRKGIETIAEHGYAGRTAQALAITFGLLHAVGHHAMADALAGGTFVHSKTLSTKPDAKGISARDTFAAFGTSSTVALAYLKTALVYFEMSIRAESRWREEEKARGRALAS